ncbi:Protein VdlD [Diplonema papillatum]|nr:Protein VdlD [Diplonema papillatum]KAJ9441652.1 Protein VdlD [Diplonema papillatum]|eukprot:gene9643-14971_t
MLSRTVVPLAGGAAKRLQTMVAMDVVGNESIAGTRMGAGSMLGLMDLCSVRAAQSHAKEALVEHNGSVATVAVDACDFSSPVLHGDLIKVETTPVQVGKSSIAVRVVCSRRDLRMRGWEPVQKATYTLVVVDKLSGRPLKVVPPLEYVTEDEFKLQEEFAQRRSMLTEWAKVDDKLACKPLSELEGPSEVLEGVSLDIEETSMKMRRLFLPRHLNFNNTIFGGDLLEWMESGAKHCAMNFVGHRDVATLAMNRVEFKHPISINDWVELHARVVYVSKYTVHVELKILKEESGVQEPVTSHVGHFVCMPTSPHTGRKKPVMTGLRIRPDDIESRRCYHAAKHRFEFWKRVHLGLAAYNSQ